MQDALQNASYFSRCWRTRQIVLYTLKTNELMGVPRSRPLSIEGIKEMIDEEATFEKFGYYSTDWAPKSDKKIVAGCDGCGRVRILFKHGYCALCNSCATKGERNHHFGKHPSEETRKKISDAQKGENNHNWKNGASFEPYCEKFNAEFKEYIRDKFRRICFLCGKTEEENGERLSVHHVNGNKECGCDGDKTCQFVPLCRVCHGKVHSKKTDWEAKI